MSVATNWLLPDPPVSEADVAGSKGERGDGLEALGLGGKTAPLIVALVGLAIKELLPAEARFRLAVSLLPAAEIAITWAKLNERLSWPL